MDTNDRRLHERVSRDVLLHLLEVRGESDSHDFKLTIDLKSKRHKAELAKDILAFANTEGGGYLVFGVANKNFELVGLESSITLDTTEVYKAIRPYFDGELNLVAATYDLSMPGWDSARRFGILYIERYTGIAIAKCSGQYGDNGQTEAAFHEGDILVRRGAQSCRADSAAVHRLTRGQDQTEDNAPEYRRPLDSNLPPREEVAVDFVGRSRELTELWIWFRDPLRRRWLLAGDGGKGKTAIAYEFATQVRENAPEGFHYVLWLSAKRRRYVEGSVHDILAPDFWDLPSLLDAILSGYDLGEEYLALSPGAKRDTVLEILRKLPALVIADDIDSLDPDNEAAIEFLASGLGDTTSKVLLTARRVPFGLNSSKTQVQGLTDPDGEDFVRSRVRLLQLDPQLFGGRQVRRILNVTDGSPLYIEDLIRSCTVLKVDDAISKWEGSGGNAAREYALKCELEQLSPLAQEIMIACCIPDVPVSLAELQLITKSTEDQVAQEIQPLQSLFLVSQPKLIEDDERFDVNANTRRLVMHVFNDSEMSRRIRDAYRQASDRRSRRASREIGSYIRQANSLQRLGDQRRAEEIIVAALNIDPNNADLIGEMGVIYSRWQPSRRVTDARARFGMASNLHCRKEWMYSIWTEMELHASEWTSAAKAAEEGIQNLGGSRKLAYYGGYARSRLGQELRRGLHQERAAVELAAAKNLLEQALLEPERLAGYEDRRLNSKVFRALVLNAEELGELARMRRLLDRWVAEHPDDPFAQSEASRLRAKYPTLAPVN